ncbi:MAG: SpoIIE family protein phosphatase [Candidatus Cloacimonetes bacterium]|nr:SpoIIE family protein phosphatase [Candidatus Cloacimonadota bacterium]
MDKLGISLLYVEDEESIRDNMITNLRRRVDILYSAENGEEGLAKFLEFKPDLIITDIKMPVMNGLEMIKRIREIKENTKIIMLSAHSDTRSLLEAIEIGVNGYILKPFQTGKLFKLIEDLAKDIILDKTVQEQSKKINELYNSLVKDLETAGSVQEYLLPARLIIEPDLFYSSTYVPSTKIGGDLYDLIKLSDGKYITYIGDISGHGVKAALLMTAVKSTINRVIEDEGLEEPYEILNRLNNILSRELFSTDYMTLIVCHIDCSAKKLRFMNAGHPPLIIWNGAANEIKSIVPEGSIPVGWMPHYIYTPDEEFETDFDPEHLFFLYTDGLFECENKEGVELGLEGLMEFIRENVAKYPKVIAPQMIRKALAENHYDISADDFTLVAFSFIPEVSKQGDKRFFIGELDDDINLLVKKTSEYVRKVAGDIAMSNAIDAALGNWLEEKTTMKDLDEKEKRYLAKLEMMEGGVIRMMIWSRLLDLVGNSDVYGKKKKSKSEFLEIQYIMNDYDDFSELQLDFRKI